MKVISEVTLTDFKFWSGVEDNAKMLTYKELEQLTDILENAYNEGMTDTEINDLMWFEFGEVCNMLGLEYDEENDKIKSGGN